MSMLLKTRKSSKDLSEHHSMMTCICDCDYDTIMSYFPIPNHRLAGDMLSVAILFALVAGSYSQTVGSYVLLLRFSQNTYGARLYS